MKNNLIKCHLRNLIILGIPVRALRSGAFYPGCRLRLRDDGESFGLLGASGDPRPGRIVLTYTIDGYMYGFETDVTGTDNLEGEADFLCIGLPQKIVRIEKPIFCRVMSPENQPVKVTAIPGSEEIEAHAIAMSEEHLGLVLSVPHPGFAIDTVLTLTITLPGLGEVAAKGAVRFLRDSSGAQGLVVGLDEMAEPDRGLLGRYVRSREVEMHARNGTPRRESSFIVTRNSEQGSHVFWCPAPFMGSFRATDVALDVASVDAVDYLAEV
jgi:hypothetical protein